MKRRTEHFTYELVRARRRSMSLKVELDGTITVRAPFRTPPETADWFVESHRDWIEVRLRAGEQILAVRPSYTETERLEGKKSGKRVKERCCYYAGLMGVSYGSITVREQKTRWGSCSAKGNLNFNWKLVLMPEEILEYVVVHELAHRLQMNHSMEFWDEVEKILPDYRKRRQWLKENGQKY
ncbi:MAG: M48 family metallopeptidase [Roseburia sp.]